MKKTNAVLAIPLKLQKPAHWVKPKIGDWLKL